MAGKEGLERELGIRREKRRRWRGKGRRRGR